MATTINVRLCGGIPRSDFQGAPRRCTSEPTHQLCDGHDHIVPQSNQTMKSLDIPQWAVPAQGETRLEVRTYHGVNVIQLVVWGSSSRPADAWPLTLQSFLLTHTAAAFSRSVKELEDKQPLT